MRTMRHACLSAFNPVYALALAFYLLATQCPAQQTSQRLHKYVPSVVSSSDAQLVGAVPASKDVDMTILLPIRDQEGLTTLLGELYDPSSPKYRHFLSVQQFTDAFSPTMQDYQSVIQWASGQGFAIIGQSKNRLVLNVRGKAAQVNAAFNVVMNEYRDPKENRNFFSIDREPTLNTTLPIAHIQGLSNYAIPHPMLKRDRKATPVADVTGSGPGGYYLGSDMRAAYYGGTLLTGAGQCVGILEFGGYRTSDVNLTFNNAGQAYSVPINNVLIDGATAAAGSDDAEEVLDITQAIGMAPGLSQVRVYIGVSGHDADIFNEMTTENVCKQLSVSWGWTDDAGQDDHIFQELAAQGQSLFVASGDSGAFDSAVNADFFPAEDAYVTSVGGTHLITNYGGGPWVAESAWNSSGYGSGGGASPDEIPIPSWQQGVATYSNGGSPYLRNVPDISMEADFDNYLCDMGACTGGFGGTSFAAPRWAGFMALVNQQAADAGTAPSGGLGFINPALYSIGEGTNYSADFHDVTSGNNDTDNQPVWYNAINGYDLVTGWGSPNGQALIDALAGTVIPGFWLSASPASLSVAQDSLAMATIGVTNAGGFSSSVALTVSGLPSGVTAAFNPSSTSGTSVLTLTASNSATVGPATLTVSGTSGSLSSKATLFLTVNPPAPPPQASGGFGSLNVGSAGSPAAMTLTFTAAGTLGNIGVLTQGVANLDFANAGGGTCAVGTAYTAGATCTVNVTFAPKHAGARYGAVVLSDASSNPLATLYIEGTGTGPQATFNPGTQTTVGSAFVEPEAIATLGDGSLYVTDFGNGTGTSALYFEQYLNGIFTQSKTNCSFTTPVGVAVDGSGTIYVADPGVPAVYKVVIANGTCTKTAIGSGFGQPWGVAADGSGDVYITDLGTTSIAAAVYKETLQANGTYVQSLVGSGWVTPGALAVDQNGDVVVADYSIPGVFLETPSGGSYTQSPIGSAWTKPIGVAVDGSGSFYVADAGNALTYGGSIPAGIYKEVAASGTYIQSAITSQWLALHGVAVDSLGNVFAVDQTRGIFKNDLADPPAIGFVNTVNGTTSSDSPKTVTVSNIGTSALQFSSVTYPTDFPEASGIATDCASSTSLGAGAGCTLSVIFHPTTALGTSTSLALNESLAITTDTLNANGTQQNVALSGTEVLPGGSVTLSVSANPIAAGASLTLTAAVASPIGGTAPTGTVIFLNGSTPIGGPVTLSNGVATYSTNTLAAGTYSMVASYSGDANYVASTSNTVVESIISAPATSSFGDTNIGSQNVGSTSAAVPLNITFSSAETLGAIQALTEGVPNQDFAIASGGTCTVGTAYSANSTCTVNVTFSPKYAGTRYGAVVLTDNNNNVIGTGYLEGVGTGPQATFLPGTLSSVASGFGFPQGVAVDGSGNVYVADARNAAVYKEVLASGAYSQQSVGSGFNEPSGIAIDAAGNIYVTDVGNHAVYRETPSNGGYIQTVIGYGFIWPSGVAVDALGNVYVADFGNGVNLGTVYVETNANGTYTQSTIGSGFVSPQGIAVDGSGNVYVADPANGNVAAAVYKLSPSSGTYSQTTIGTGWVTPTGVAVDGVGNVYVSDDAFGIGDGFVVKEALQPNGASGSYAQSVLLGAASTPYPGGVSVDGQGNLYIADNLDGILYRDTVATPPALSFATTFFGSTSSDSPKTVTVENAGNVALTFSALSYPADFPEAPGVATDCTSTTSLGAGTACTLSVNFTPASLKGSTQSTSLSESVTLTTNSLNSSANAQAISVSGTEAAPIASVTLTAPTNVATIGTPVTLVASVTGPQGVVAPTGTVTFLASGTSLGTASLSNGIASFSVNSLAVGTYNITATYSGDQNYASKASNAIFEQVIPAATFGVQSIGTTSSTTITVTFASRVTVGSIAVVTQGMSNLDFTNPGGGTCTAGTAYAAGATCTVNVAFNPRFAGTRYGAIVIGDNKGNLAQTIYLQGTGTGAELSFSPTVQSSIATLNSAYDAFTVDGNGNVYFAQYTASGTYVVKKLTPVNGTFTESSVPTATTLSDPTELAVDGSGSVYIRNQGSSLHKGEYCDLLKETPVNGTYQETIIESSSVCNFFDFAIGGMGDLYINTGVQFVKYTPSGTGYITTTIPLGTTYGPPYGIAVDAVGNLYFSDYVDDVINRQFGAQLVKETANSGYSESVITSCSSSVAPCGYYGYPVVDADGNVYFFNTLNGNLIQATPTGRGYSLTNAVPSGELANAGIGIGLDGAHNLYVASTPSNVAQLVKVDSSDPPSLAFASTVVGSTSSDSPKVIGLSNVGNSPLTLSVPGSGTNPSVATNFSLNSQATTCPQVTATDSVATLAPNASCNYGINFLPTASGTINGSMILTDNALNSQSGTQTIPLNGTGTNNTAMAIMTIGPGGTPQVKWVPLGAQAGPVSLNGSLVDTYHSTFIFAVAEFVRDQYGNATCTEISPGNLQEVKDVYGGKWLTEIKSFTLPNNQCPGTIYQWSAAYDTWGSDSVNLVDPFMMHWTTPDGQFNETISSNTIFDHIAVSPAVPNGSGPNPPLVATATLLDVPAGAAGYDWEIVGGNGTIVFANGKETISSSTNSIPVEEPNPTGASIPFTIQVGVRYSTATSTTTSAESDPLLYGPTQDAFCGVPTISSISPNVWFAGQTYNVTITGAGFNPTPTQSCPQSNVLITMSNGGIITANVTSITPNLITATVTPAANDSTGGATVAISGELAPTPNADVLGQPTIQCSDPGMQCSGQTISGPNPTPQTAIVGQKIYLTTTPSANDLAGLPIQLTFTQNVQQWLVRGTNIGGYSPSTGQTNVTETTLTSQDLTTYWVYSATSVPVTYEYCVNNPNVSPLTSLCSGPTTATFNIQGPSATITPTPHYWSVTPQISCSSGTFQVLVFGVPDSTSGCSLVPLVTGISFQASLSNVPNSGGTTAWVQVIRTNTVSGTTLSGAQATPTDLGVGLDKSFPYPPDDPTVSVTMQSSDTPTVPLDSSLANETRTFKADMYYLWQSSIPDSIFVPLVYVDWSTYGTAVQQTANTPPWSLQTSGPVTKNVFILNSDTDPSGIGIPTWTN